MIYLAATLFVVIVVIYVLAGIIAGAIATVESVKELGIDVRDPSSVERKGPGPPIKTLKQLQQEEQE